MLHKRKLIADRKLIQELEKQFELVENNLAEWTKTYLDTETDSKWLCFYVDTEYHGGGSPVCGKLPLPDTNELINIAMTSEYEDEVFAACKTLTEKEKSGNCDFREMLVDKLVMLKDKNRRIKIIELTALDFAINRQVTNGKTFDQIESDFNHYKEIAEKAKRLKR
ncbi:hypothetical protein [Sunxiuqinia indica]|uniref:hypothetical protein n=1 Tax=Sunxiuqinia indica TaxID=2692584 RepID=UPI001358DD88|nr:hypothetical protein [Sunxiuqinia indica]